MTIHFYYYFVDVPSIWCHCIVLRCVEITARGVYDEKCWMYQCAVEQLSDDWTIEFQFIPNHILNVRWTCSVLGSTRILLLFFFFWCMNKRDYCMCWTVKQISRPSHFQCIKCTLNMNTLNVKWRHPPHVLQPVATYSPHYNYLLYTAWNYGEVVLDVHPRILSEICWLIKSYN